ncbi:MULTISPECIES: hypothetical protein [unclassified Streptomyces]|uniref:hypothetical protein n=1 Tax=unclassified Streptomyces TaxID=2593676 RepID=UPI0037FF4487
MSENANAVAATESKELYMSKLRERLEAKKSGNGPVFEVREVSRDSQPFLKQCCIR